MMHRSKWHLHLITSSARPSSIGGTSIPIAFAVLRLITQLVFGGRLHRQIARLLALEDAIDKLVRSAAALDASSPRARRVVEELPEFWEGRDTR
jgi:hypothetical protein